MTQYSLAARPPVWRLRQCGRRHAGVIRLSCRQPQISHFRLI